MYEWFFVGSTLSFEATDQDVTKSKISFLGKTTRIDRKYAQNSTLNPDAT